ncbi:MAG: hypothetical protein AB1611_08690 [bacterium]
MRKAATIMAVSGEAKKQPHPTLYYKRLRTELFQRSQESGVRIQKEVWAILNKEFFYLLLAPGF